MKERNKWCKLVRGLKQKGVKQGPRYSLLAILFNAVLNMTVEGTVGKADIVQKSEQFVLSLRKTLVQHTIARLFALFKAYSGERATGCEGFLLLLLLLSACPAKTPPSALQPFEA
jgi:hypothetical protein